MERLSKFIASCGVASRREAEKLIDRGLVKVNGVTIREQGVKITEHDIVELNGSRLSKQCDVNVWVFYKPRGCVCTRSDEMNRPTIYDHLPDDMQKLLYVGRLDLNSEGLLLLTNNGALKREYEQPDNGMKRVYTCRVFGRLPEGFFGNYSKNGIKVIEPKSGDEITYHAVIEPVRVSIESNIHIVKFTLEEGKNREIRNICSHFGLKVARLKRVSYGKYNLGNMQPGEIMKVFI
ncbi:MAG TPA: hypothetical protein DIV86_02600 [Alphaproteobacteria bacterium]|nr:hypothetical protein [Alphaproteobacteria bacterium]